MKKNILFTILAVAILGLSGCKKNDNFITEDYYDLLEAVPVVSVKKEASGNQAIDLLNLPGFSGKFTVSLFFPSQPPPTKVDIVVRKNGSAANVKVFQANVTTFPTTYTVTAAQIVALFNNVPIALDDTYDFGADIYTEKGKYQTFPTTAIGYAPGPVGQPLYSQFARFAAICAYDPDMYQGNFVVIQDDFEEWFPGDVVVLTKIDNTHFSFLPAVTFGGATRTPVVVTVNPLDNVITVPKQQVGATFYQYFLPNWASVPSPLNIVAPCAKEFGLLINYTVSAGSFGNAYFKLRKQ